MTRKHKSSPATVTVPGVAWRDPLARIEALEESSRRAIAAGTKLVRIVRKP